MSMQEINQKLSTINRVVIHPKYRTVGLGAKLIRESLPLVGTDFVELIAVMAKYSPFAEKAGMKRISQQTEVKSVVKISQTLSSLGFDVQLLGSQHYVKQQLDTLDTKQLCSVREVLLKNPQPRLKKEVTSSRHMPYGITADYVKYVEAADSEKLSKLIKTVALLLQTKVYLFWSRQTIS
jgi:ABC-type ATPase with predicted acetyltransferase domain